MTLIRTCGDGANLLRQKTIDFGGVLVERFKYDEEEYDPREVRGSRAAEGFGISSDAQALGSPHIHRVWRTAMR